MGREGEGEEGRGPTPKGVGGEGTEGEWREFRQSQGEYYRINTIPVAE